MWRFGDAWRAFVGGEVKAAPTVPGADYIVSNLSNVPTITAAQLDAAVKGGIQISSMLAAAYAFIAENFAEPPLCALRNGEPDPEHPLSRAFSRPTFFHTQTWLWQRLAYAWLTDPGGCYLVAALDGASEIGALWVRSSKQIRPIKSGTAYIEGWEWLRNGIPERVDEKKFRVCRLAFPSPDLDDEFSSWTPQQQVAKEVRTQASASLWLDYILQNMGKLSALIGVDHDGITPQIAKDMQDEINERWTGAHRAGTIGVAAGKISVAQLGLDFGSLDFGALTDRLEIAIARATRIPAELLQTLATAKQGEGLSGNAFREKSLIAYDNRIVPMWAQAAEAVGMFFGELYGLTPEEVAFDTSDVRSLANRNLVVADTVAKIGAYIEPNEGRDLLGLEPKPWGDTPPTSVQLASRLAAMGGGEPDPNGAKSWIRPEHKNLRALVWEQKATTREPTFRKIAQRVFAAEKRDVLDVLGKMDTGDWDRAVDLWKMQPGESDLDRRTRFDQRAFVVKAWHPDDVSKAIDEKRWIEAYHDVVTATLVDGAGDAASTLGASFDIHDPRAVDAALKRTLALAGDVTGTTRKQVNALTAEALENGWSPNDLAKRVSEDVFGAERISNRSWSIARTEALHAANEGGQIGASSAASELGLTVQKSWITAHDTDVREEHLACEAQGAIPLHQPYVGGPMFPGDFGDPAQDINCRCVEVYDAQ